MAGLVFNLFFKWNTSLAFGVTGVLWALGPIMAVFRQLSKGKIAGSVVFATMSERWYCWAGERWHGQRGEVSDGESGQGGSSIPALLCFATLAGLAAYRGNPSLNPVAVAAMAVWRRRGCAYGFSAVCFISSMAPSGRSTGGAESGKP